VLGNPGVVDGTTAEGATGVELGCDVVVLLVEAGFTEVELDGHAALFTPTEGFFVGIPGIFSSEPIQSLSQSTPGLAFWSSGKATPKASAIL
jgi:hypothetical protein